MFNQFKLFGSSTYSGGPFGINNSQAENVAAQTPHAEAGISRPKQTSNNLSKTYNGMASFAAAPQG